jgi:hypothetical protein
VRKRTICHEPSTFKRSFAFSFRGREVYTSVERIHCLPLWVDGSRGNAGHSLFGAEGLLYGRRAKEAPYQNRITITSVEPSEDVG